MNWRELSFESKIMLSVITSLVLVALFSLASCQKEDVSRTFADVAEQNRSKSAPVSDISLEEYEAFGEYWPFVQYTEGQSPLDFSGFVLTSSPFGSLRGARDTVNDIDYDAWEFSTTHQGVEYESVIIFDQRGPGKKYIYAIEANEQPIGFVLPENPTGYVWGPDSSVSVLEAFYIPFGQQVSYDLSQENEWVGGLVWQLDYIASDGLPETIIIQQDSSATDFGSIKIAASSTDVGVFLQPCQFTTWQITLTAIDPTGNIQGSRTCTTTRQGEFPPQQPVCESVVCDFPGGFELIE